jgi:hypothetical protein
LSTGYFASCAQFAQIWVPREFPFALPKISRPKFLSLS